MIATISLYCGESSFTILFNLMVKLPRFLFISVVIIRQIHQHITLNLSSAGCFVIRIAFICALQSP